MSCEEHIVNVAPALVHDSVAGRKQAEPLINMTKQSTPPQLREPGIS
jgi:hypothetical protein